MPEDRAWLEVVLAAADLLCWSKLICFTDVPVLAHCEIDAFRYAILHTPAKISLSARQVHLHLDRTWPWAKALEQAFCRLRAGSSPEHPPPLKRTTTPRLAPSRPTAGSLPRRRPRTGDAEALTPSSAMDDT